MDLQNGYIQKIKESELYETKYEKQWYMPHHPVINPDKFEEVRSVCKAAVEYKGMELNEELLTKPDLLQNLVGTIFRFRGHQVVLTAEIEAMFLQVVVPPQGCRM